MTKDEELVTHLQQDWRQAKLDPAEQAMLAYVEKLTVAPWQVIPADVDSLRAAGFSDREILDINQIAGYYAYVNRLASGLGVELEDFWEEDA